MCGKQWVFDFCGGSPVSTTRHLPGCLCVWRERWTFYQPYYTKFCSSVLTVVSDHSLFFLYSQTWAWWHAVEGDGQKQTVVKFCLGNKAFLNRQFCVAVQAVLCLVFQLLYRLVCVLGMEVGGDRRARQLIKQTTNHYSCWADFVFKQVEDGFCS